MLCIHLMFLLCAIWLFFKLNFHSSFPLKVKVKSLSRVQLFATPWTVANQTPPSMGFSRQEYWSGLPYMLKSKYWFYQPSSSLIFSFAV